MPIWIFLTFHDQIRATVYSISTLSWSGRLTPLLPDKTAFLKSGLQVFLSRNWLSDSHIDQLTYLLEKDLQEQKKSSDVHLIDSILARKILFLYDVEKNNNQIYLPEGDDFYWQRFGVRLGPKSRIGAIFHINGNHWVSTVVDVAMEELAYGDPMKGNQDTRIKAALLWFISKHVTSLDPAAVDDDCLPCPSQSVTSDWFNCGVFSHNALSHCFLHEPILQYTYDPVFGDLERLRILRKLIMTHNATVCGVHPELKSIAHRDLEPTRASHASLAL
jgi:Ulp1 family protease